MEIINDGSTLVLQNKNYEYNGVLDELIEKGGSDVVQIFMNNEILVPRVLNVRALREVLDLRIPKARVLDLSDEMLYRLRSYESFSEFQLQNLFNEICDSREEFRKYLRALYDRLLKNANPLGITDEVVSALLALNDQENTFQEFEDELFKVSRDYRTYFDGERIEVLKETLPTSATTQELRDLGSKYGIIIPKRLRRSEIENYVSSELRKQGKLDDELKERLSKMPVMTLQRMAKNNGIRVSADLKKEDVINYLFEDATTIENKFMPKVELVGLERDFEFKQSYVDSTEENRKNAKAAKEEAANETAAENTVLLKELISEVNAVKTEKEEVKAEETDSSTVNNTETNELLRNLIDEVKATKPEEAEPVTQASTTTALLDDEAKGLLRELILEIHKSNEQKLASTNAAPNVTVVNQIDTDSLANTLAKIHEDNKASEALTEEAVEVKDNPYNFDNFTNQVNPHYDENLANKLLEDPESINLAASVALTKLEKKEAKLQNKLDAKVSKKDAKLTKAHNAKQAKLDAKEASRLEKQNKKANKKANQERINNAKKRQKQIEAAVKSGKTYDITREELNDYLKLKEFERASRLEKRDRHRDHMSKWGTFFKVLFLIILLVAIAWLVFALLFTFDQCLDIKQMLTDNGFGWLFDGAVEAFKKMFGK